jgi:hypothetical protein
MHPDPGQHDRHGTIEINLRTTSQLFNSLDPSPFRDRDLDPEASRFIIEEAEEHPPRQPIRLRIHLPQDDAAQIGHELASIPTAVRAHFARLRQSEERLLRRTLREGRHGLAVGAFVVVTLLAGIELARGLLPATQWTTGILESLTILAWVVLWRPAELLLYDWWPIARRLALLRRLETAEVDCNASPC